MINLLLYDFIIYDGSSMIEFVNDYEKNKSEDGQGFIFREYNDHFLKATYWHKRKRKEYRYNFEKNGFDEREEEIVSIANFEIDTLNNKMFVFGNKHLAQRIITLIGIMAPNAYSITEHVIDVKKMINRICAEKNMVFLRMQLVDVILDKEILVNCTVKLICQNNPADIVQKYIDNITAISFRMEKIDSNFTVYKNGKILLSRVLEEDAEKLLHWIIEIAC